MPKNFKTRKAVKDRFIIDNMNESHIEAFMKKKVAQIEKELGMSPQPTDDYVNLTLELGIWSSLQIHIGYEINQFTGGTFAFRSIFPSVDKHLEYAKKQIELEQIKRVKDE